MEENKLDNNLFDKYKEKIIDIDHYETCCFAGRTIPINECTCDCYEKQIFKMGRDAERDLFYS